jgi:predicted PurR-regulated permease PerM
MNRNAIKDWLARTVLIAAGIGFWYLILFGARWVSIAAYAAVLAVTVWSCIYFLQQYLKSKRKPTVVEP